MRSLQTHIYFFYEMLVNLESFSDEDQQYDTQNLVEFLFRSSCGIISKLSFLTFPTYLDAIHFQASKIVVDRIALDFDIKIANVAMIFRTPGRCFKYIL